MNFNKNFLNEVKRIFLVFKTIIRMPISYSRERTGLFSSIHDYIFFFMTTKVNRSTKSDFFYKFQKNHNKKTDNQKKKLLSPLPPT